MLINIQSGHDGDCLPDYKEEIVKAEKLLSLEESLDYLAKVDYALYGFNNNLNVNLIISSFFSNFMVREYV